MDKSGRIFPPRFLVTPEDHVIWNLSTEKLFPILEMLQEYVYRRHEAEPENAELHRFALELTLGCAGLIVPAVVLLGKNRLSGVKPYWLKRLMGASLVETTGRLELPDEMVRRCMELELVEKQFADYVVTHYMD